MATRYSKRRPDGTTAYYDSEEAMRADGLPDRGMFDFSIFYAIVGFFVSVVVAGLVVYGLDLGAGWPKPLRFGAMLLGVGAGSYLIGRLGFFLFLSFWLVLGAVLVLGVLGAVIAIFWHLA